MGKIIFIDDRPIMAANLAKEWARYYDNMWGGKTCPTFYIITLYDKEKMPVDWKDLGKSVNEQLKELNHGRSKYFHQIEIEKKDEKERKKEIETKLSEFMEKNVKRSPMLLALDLHLFYGDGKRIEEEHTIVSMDIYRFMKSKHRKVLLYTSFSDEKELAFGWKQAYEKKWGEEPDFIYARENALNYDVLVESAKELLNGVLKK